MKKPKAFNMYLDHVGQLLKLSDEQAGQLIKGLLIYANEKTEPDFDDLAVDLMFDMMSKQIDRDFAKYDEVCQKRSKAGKISATKQAKKSTHVNTCCQDEDENENKYEDKYEEENKYKNNNEYEYKNEDEAKKESLSDDGTVDRASPTIDRDIRDVIDHLNKRADTHYRTDSQRSRQLISAKLSDNYTVADMKAVIDRKCKEWLGTEYEKYLRPDTLFGERFESYLNTPENPRRPNSKLHKWQNDSQDSFLRQAQAWEERSAELLDNGTLYQIGVRS